MARAFNEVMASKAAEPEHAKEKEEESDVTNSTEVQVSQRSDDKSQSESEGEEPRQHICDVTQLGTGDQVIVYAGSDSIRKVGLWDERFAFMHHDSDFFHRLRVHLPDRSCLHDYAIRRVHRPMFGIGNDKD